MKKCEATGRPGNNSIGLSFYVCAHIGKTRVDKR